MTTKDDSPERLPGPGRSLAASFLNTFDVYGKMVILNKAYPIIFPERS